MYVCMYMYYTSNWFIPSIFLLSALVPFFMVISSSLNVLYSFLYRKYINYIHLLYILLLPCLSHQFPPLSVALHCLGVCCSMGFLPWYFTYKYIKLESIYPLSTVLPYPFPHPVLFNSFQRASFCLVPAQMWYILLLFTILLFSSSFSLSLLYQSHFWVHVLCIFICICDIPWICIGPICLLHMRENMRPSSLKSLRWRIFKLYAHQLYSTTPKNVLHNFSFSFVFHLRSTWCHHITLAYYVSSVSLNPGQHFPTTQHWCIETSIPHTQNLFTHSYFIRQCLLLPTSLYCLLFSLNMKLFCGILG
jgi:hypothetical protein